MKVAIIGSGAIGAFYGARLLTAGNEVHFLFHSDFAHVCEHGLRVDSTEGDMFFSHVNAYGRAEDMPVCELVLVATKATANNQLVNLLTPVCGPETVVLLLQNGLNGERAIARLGLNAQVLGGLCFVCCNKKGPGHIAHLEFGKIQMGAYREDEKPAGETPALLRVAEAFRHAQIPVETSADLLLSRWRKLFWNIAYNGPCSLLAATTSQIMGNPATRQLAHDLMEEVRLGAQSVGRDIPQSFIQEMLNYTDTMKPYKPSMMLDAENHRALEVEAIYGEPLRTARERGVELSAIRTVYQQLTFLDAKLRAAR